MKFWRPPDTNFRWEWSGRRLLREFHELPRTKFQFVAISEIRVSFPVSTRRNFLRTFAAIDEKHHRHADRQTVSDLFKNQ
jgi:hypothetical protein